MKVRVEDLDRLRRVSARRHGEQQYRAEQHGDDVAGTMCSHRKAPHAVYNSLASIVRGPIAVNRVT
jgi:hypothetical protein